MRTSTLRLLALPLFVILSACATDRPEPREPVAADIAVVHAHDPLSPEAASEAGERKAAILREADSLPDGHWAGAYPGVHVRLWVAPNAGFVYEFEGCLGTGDRNYGRVIEAEDGLTF